MMEWPRFRCYAAAEPRGAEALRRSDAKRIHFVRHGEALHQQRATPGRACHCHESPTAEEIANCPYMDPDLVDPPLTDAGRRQVARVEAELWFAGAAMRSLETATIAASTGIVALEEIRSRVSAHPHTRRRPLSVLKPLFPRVDFSRVASDEDPLFTGMAEPRAKLDRRLAEFLRVLAARPEREIAVVTHFTMFLTLFQSPSETLVVGTNPERSRNDPPFLDCREGADPERLRSFFEPGEVRSLVIVP